MRRTSTAIATTVAIAAAVQAVAHADHEPHIELHEHLHPPAVSLVPSAGANSSGSVTIKVPAGALTVTGETPSSSLTG